MALTRTGFKKAQRMLERLPEATRRHLTEANEDNASLVVRTAKVLVPVGKTARSRAAIKSTPEGDAGQMIDFGPLSAILEGGTEERFHKSGKSTGRGPARPFVGPTMRATLKQRRKRANKAVKDAIEEAKANG